MSEMHPDPQFRSSVRRQPGRNALPPYEHVLSVSGGKDSTALYLLALERGMPFRAVMADTGHEHPWTYEYVAELPTRTGGPAVELVKADFSAAMSRKRRFILEHWERRGVPAHRVARAAELLVPTGNPFLDLCMMKGRFPGAKSRFCTDELKLVPMWLGVQQPILQAGRALISWQGVRGQESLARRYLPRWQRYDPVPYCLPKRGRKLAEEAEYRAYTYRPIHAWSVGDVFAMHARHGIQPNPLYAEGVSRVGCWPCIFARKDELRTMARISPEEIERVAEWEAIVGEVAKRSAANGTAATFFCASDDPLYEKGMDVNAEAFGIRARIGWAMTSRGGRQYDLMAYADAMGSCAATGVCE